MPRLMPRRPKFKDGDRVICWMSFSSDHVGGTLVMQRGTRLRASHPAVRNHSQWFVLDNGDELPSPHMAVPDPPTQPPEFTRPETTIPPDRQVVATQNFMVGFGTGPTVSKGQVFDQADALVLKHPEFFAIPQRPLKRKSA